LLEITTFVDLMVEHPIITWLRFVIWLVIGLVFYFFYGSRRSRLSESLAAKARMDRAAPQLE
jgi:APA family basic amino acid/polyamine antiporter